MTRRRVSFVRAASMAAALFLLAAPLVRAGEHVRAAPPPPAPSQPAPVSVARVAPVVVSVVVTPAPRPAVEPVTVAVRGPDGQVRRFPVEGGRAAIRTREVILRPGEAVTIQWRGSK
jgi:hypothetical protein